MSGEKKSVSGGLTEDTISVSTIFKLYLSQWPLFLTIFLILTAVSVGIYTFKIPYVASGTVLVNDSQNSSLQAFSSQYFGFSKTIQESKKNNSLLAKHLEFLKTRDFQESLLKNVILRGQSSKISAEEIKGFEYFQKNYPILESNNIDSKIYLMQKLSKWIKVGLDSDFEIKLTVATESKELSLFLANSVVELAKVTLKERELSEIQQVEDFIIKQKEAADKSLSTIGLQLSEFQNKDESVLPLVSQDKMGDYVSDLIVRSNELKLKISDNSKMIALLQNGRENIRESRLYGIGGRIESLKIENKISASKLEELNKSISRIRQQIKKLPFASQMIEDLKKKSEIEFNKFRELSAALSRIEAQKLSIDTRFDIMEKARWETTGPQVNLMTLLFLSVLFSQVLGSLIIYFKFLWNPNTVTVQASRNLTIFDTHSIDPRVIIENSKIKFSLKNFKASDDEPELLEGTNNTEFKI